MVSKFFHTNYLLCLFTPAMIPRFWKMLPVKLRIWVLICYQMNKDIAANKRFWPAWDCHYHHQVIWVHHDTKKPDDFLSLCRLVRINALLLSGFFEKVKVSGGSLETQDKEFWFLWPETYFNTIITFCSQFPGSTGRLNTKGYLK